MSVGEPIDRVDGRLKVTGRATYTADQNVPGLVFGVLVTSAIAKGRISSIDISAAQRVPGTLAVLTHNSSLKLAKDPAQVDPKSPADRALQVLQDDRIFYGNQPIAIAVAETLEAPSRQRTGLPFTIRCRNHRSPSPQQASRMPICPRKWVAPEIPRKASAAPRKTDWPRQTFESKRRTPHPFRLIRRLSRTRPLRYGKAPGNSHSTTLRREFSATASALQLCSACSRKMYGLSRCLSVEVLAARDRRGRTV